MRFLSHSGFLSSANQVRDRTELVYITEECFTGHHYYRLLTRKKPLHCVIIFIEFEKKKNQHKQNNFGSGVSDFAFKVMAVVLSLWSVRKQ